MAIKKSVERRKNGEGSLYRMKDGRWGAAVYFQKDDGNTGRKVFTGKSQEDVSEKMTKWLQENELISNGHQTNVNSHTSIEDFVQEFKSAYLRESGITPRTYENYSYALKRFTNKFKDSEIGIIDVDQINAFLVHMANEKIENTDTYKYSKASIRLTIQLLDKMFSRAVKKGSMAVNPIRDPDFHNPKVKKQTEPVMGLQGDQLQELLDVISTNSLLKPVIILMVNTGMRTQEVLGLCWKNINLTTGAIHITNAITTTVEINANGKKHGKRKTILSDPKTNKSNRTVYVDNETLEVIKQWKVYARAKTKTQFGKNDYMFGNTKNSRLTYGGFRTTVNKFLKNSECSENSLRLHSLRHTVATLLAIDGATCPEIMKQLGHSHVETTLRYIDDAAAVNIKNCSRISKSLESIKAQKDKCVATI